MKIKAGWLLLVVGVLSMLGATRGAARADALDPPWCEVEGSHDRAHFGLAQVSGSDRLHLQYGPTPCQHLPGCDQKAYVIPGDILITQTQKGGMVCVIYPKSGVVGWAPIDRLRPQPVPVPTLASWQGMWRQNDNFIDLKVRAGQLVGHSVFLWPSSHPAKSRPGVMLNDGGFDGVAKPIGNQVTFVAGPDEIDCTVRLTLVGPWLVAADNNHCSGVNANVLGVLSRK